MNHKDYRRGLRLVVAAEPEQNRRCYEGYFFATAQGGASDLVDPPRHCAVFTQNFLHSATGLTLDRGPSPEVDPVAFTGTSGGATPPARRPRM